MTTAPEKPKRERKKPLAVVSPPASEMEVTEAEDGGYVILNDLFPTDGRRFWTENIVWRTDENGRPDPYYKVMEAAKFFFGKGPDWMRWRSGEDRATSHPHGWFILDGEKLEPRRTPSGARYYSLFDIERMAYGLTEQHGIDGETLGWIVTLVKNQALLHGYQI